MATAVPAEGVILKRVVEATHSISPEGLSPIAREPVERRPTIRAWLPRGFVPPQVTIVSAKPSPEVLMVQSLGAKAVQQPRLSGDDVLYWRSDIF